MKKILLVLACSAFALGAMAGEMPKKPSVAGFVSNGFWDNWEISVGAGIGTALSNGPDMGSLGKRLGFEGNISVTKWLHPVAGVRAQLQGGRFANFDSQLGKLKWPYLFAHVDFMINLSNWAGGYRADRAYYGVPFVGFGYLASNFTDRSQAESQTGSRQNFAFAYGWLSKFRISPAFDFNIELKGLLTPSRICPAEMGGSYLFGFSATAGFTYRFNKRGWERGVAGYTADDIRAFQEAVASSQSALDAAHAEAQRLNKKLSQAEAEAAAAREAAAKAKAAAKAEAAKVKSDAPKSLILFDYGVSKLSTKEKTRLDLMADLIKSGPKDKVYTIVGHADQQTGSAAGNKRVAENRAKGVYDYLVSKGVNPKQLTYEGKGNEKDIYPVQKANRAAVIK